MAIREKRILHEVLVCDYCETDIEDTAQSTHLVASTQGFFKKDRHEFDLCMACATKIGLRRRGRLPATMTAAKTNSAPKNNTKNTAPGKKRGRPRKNPEPVQDETETTPIPVGPVTESEGDSRPEHEW